MHKVKTATRELRPPTGNLKDENRGRTLSTMTKAAKTDKEIVEDLLPQLPDDVSLYDIAQELEFIAAVRQGLAELDENKDSISIEAVKRELPSWSVTVGRQRRGRQQRTSASTRKEPAKRKAGDSLKSPAPSPNA